MKYIIFLTIITLCGCTLTNRETAKTSEHETGTVTKTTTETAKPNEAGIPVLTERVTIFTEQVEKGKASEQLKETLTVPLPPIGAMIEPLANVAAPGLGSALGGIFGWLTGTPEGAGTGLAAATLMAGLVKRGISGEIKTKKQDRHIRAIIKGNSDFMQAHPEHADKLKAAQRSAQADPELKAAVKQARVEGGLA